MRNLFTEYLDKYFEKNKNSILLTADLGFSVFDKFRLKYPDRFINVGVAEQNMVGIASGLNSKGLNVFIYSISNFGVLRCLEQIRNDIIYHKLNIKLCCVGGGFAYGNLGYTHLGVEDLGCLSIFDDNIEIFCPSTKSELSKLIPKFFNSKKFSYLRLYRNKEKELRYDEINDYFSMNNQLQKNLIVTVGPISEEIFKLKSKNYCHINFHTINSIPKKLFISIFNKRVVKNIIFIEEHVVNGSFYNYYILKCAEYKIFTKNLINRHFILSNYKKSGSYNFLRNFYKMTSKHIDKILFSL